MTDKLIPCSDFVLQQPESSRERNNAIKYWNCMNYAKFLKQPLELWMFIPCDADNKPLKEPDVQCLRSGSCQCGEEQVSDCRDWKYEYQAACDRVLFEGFTLCDRGDKNLCIVNGDNHYLWCLYENKKIEFMTSLDLTLTPAAKKMIDGRDN